jgi:hypothetical protein
MKIGNMKKPNTYQHPYLFERKNILERTSCRWENNVKMVFKQIRREDMNWIHRSWDSFKWLAVVNMTMSLCVTQNVGEFFE